MRGTVGAENILYGRISSRTSRTIEEQVFSNQQGQQIVIKPVAQLETMHLLEYFPSGEKIKPYSAFITDDDKEKLETSSNPLELYLQIDGEAIRPYHQLNDIGNRVLQDLVYGNNVQGIIFIPARDSLKSEELDEQQLVYMDSYTDTFWRPGADTPINRPQSVFIDSADFDLTQAKSILYEQEYVSNVAIANIISSDNSARSEQALTFTLKLPQEKHDQLWRLAGERALNLEQFVLQTSIMPMDEMNAYQSQLKRAGLLDILSLAKSRLLQ